MDAFVVILFFVGCFLLSAIELRYKIPFAKWIFIIPFCLLIANRSEFVPDTGAYMDFWDELAAFEINEAIAFELGFQYYSSFLKFFIGDDVRLYFAVLTLFNLLLIDFSVFRIEQVLKREAEAGSGIVLYGNRLWRLTDFSIIPLTLYVAFFGLYFNAIILRVGVAFSLLVFASVFAVKTNRRWVDYACLVALCVISYFMHATAVVAIPLLLVLLFSRKYPTQLYLWVWVIAGVIYFTNMSSQLGEKVFSRMLSLTSFTEFTTKLSNYEGSILYETDKVAFKYLFHWSMSLVLILDIRKERSVVYAKYLNVYLLGVVIFSLFRSVLLVERVTDYFLLFSFVLFFIFLLKQRNHKFWLYYVPLVLVQMVFVLRILNREL